MLSLVQGYFYFGARENMMSDYYKSMSPEEKQKRRRRTKEFKEQYQPEGYSE
jgi:hypothetical protein